MDLTIYVNMVSSCRCGCEENHDAARCLSFVEKVGKDFPLAKIRILQGSFKEFEELKILKRNRKRIRMPVILLDGKILSIGRYPKSSDILDIVTESK